ncbi:type I polyketide synthase [Chondromyces apiculatus]|uniref:Malonyl CoA-acyl carrier protein transacylase n=1 Tax=Chondromyces apiculatus DSM 436 TaxID=1192034 RepID=A0A017STQ1_9BACT|nr:type I polyketide synthase [Chondromyces apiculatus]EYF00132.1 Malonyl CoA-acyl carrier protein transacylase [Chondromyces apiculatus DSM 436]
MSTAAQHTDYKALLQQAYVALEQMQGRLDTSERARHEPIAVVGLGCRFPGGESPDAFWELLRDGVDATGEVPRDRFDVDAFHASDPTTPGKTNARRGGFLRSVDQFDPQFFGLSPREAALMDPQQRLFLETSWEALEDAGIVPASLAGSATGVFVGVYNDDYQWLDPSAEAIHDAYNATGTSHSVLPGRLSFLLDLRGPSVAVDTACSSSLVAVHLACQSLRSGESDVAIAGGVNLILSPRPSILLSKLQVLAPDGRCKTFDAAANGFSRGEGAGVLVLKRLSRAEADGDRILALLRGSAVNQDGRSAGLTAPNPRAQAALIRQALKVAGLAPADVSYVEAHGTGTPLGDPIEIEALAEVFGQPRADGSPCLVGSVKTNFGHLEAAAGIAGLIKVVLSMDRGAIPPHLHLATLNPRIALEGTALSIPTTLTPWPARARRRCAGVSSFGVGGTNAHVVLEETPPAASGSLDAGEREPRAAYVLPLSSRGPEGLRAQARAFRDFLRGGGAAYGASLSDVCYTAGAGRTHHAHRLAAVGRSRVELAERLDAFVGGQEPPGLASGRLEVSTAPGLVFVFPGQGSQWLGMGRRLLQREPVFRDTMARCAASVERHGGWSLLDLLRDERGERGATEGSWLGRSDRIQPTLFAMQVSLAALWQSFGVTPDAVVGHSMGEVAAACVAGALSLDDAAHVICRRSHLLARSRGRGAMAVVELPAARAEQVIAPHGGALSIAAINGPTTTVVAGEATALAALLESLRRDNVFCRPVKVDVASHSPEVDPLRGELLDALRGLHPRRGTVPLCSTVTTRMTHGEDLDAGYWVRNLREPVQFLSAVRRLRDDGHQLFIEVSPHPVLLSALEQTLAESAQGGLALPSMRRDEDEQAVLMESLATLYTRGAAIDFRRIHPEARRVALPTYPFQRTRCWLDLPERVAPRPEVHVRRPALHPLLGARLGVAHPVFEAQIGREGLPYLGDHRLHGAAILPGAAYVEMALAAARAALGPGAFTLHDLGLEEPLGVPEQGAVTVQSACTRRGTDQLTIEVFSQESDGGAAEAPVFRRHALVEAVRAPEVPEGTAPVDIPGVQARCSDRVEGSAFYERLQEVGLGFGPLFRGVQQIWRREGEALGRLELPQALLAEVQAYALHPALLDAALQVLGAALPGGSPGAEGEGVLLLSSIERVRLGERPGLARWSQAQTRAHGPDGDHAGEVRLLDEEGGLVAELTGLRLRRASRAALLRHARPAHDGWLYEVVWEPRKLAAAMSTSAAAGRRWLILSDAAGVGEALAACIEERGGSSVQVRPGTAYEGDSGDRRGHAVVDPTRPDHVERLLSEAAQRGASYDSVVHLWSLDAASAHGDLDACPVDQALADLDRGIEVGCSSALSLARALTRTGQAPAPRLWLVTQGAQATGAQTRPIALAGAPLWGLGRGIGLEHPEVWGGLVDLGPGDPVEAARHLLSQLLDEEGEDQAAFRGGERHVPRLVRDRGSQATEGAAPRIRADGTYLITGGLGGLGLRVARWLVAHGAQHLTLVGRRGLPPRAAWPTLQEGTEARRAAETVEALEAAGATIDIVAADISDPGQVEALVARAGSTSPVLRGVLHAATAAEAVPLRDMTPDALAAACRAKVRGGWLLHRATAAQPLDLFVLFSSTAALWGASGLAHYAAGNQFLDALAHHRRSMDLPALSVDWGTWNEGRGATAAMRQWSTRHGLLGMAPEHALTALEHLLARGEVHRVVAAVDWSVLKPLHEARRRRPLFERIHEPAAMSPEASGERLPLLRKLTSAVPSARKGLLVVAVQDEVARILRLPPSMPVAPRQGFFELGMDSLMSVELRNRLQLALGRTLPTTLAFDHPTAEALADFLARRVLRLDLGEEQAPSQAVSIDAGRVEDDPGAAPPLSREALDDLADHEAEALLERRLAGLERRLGA